MIHSKHTRIIHTTMYTDYTHNAQYFLHNISIAAQCSIQETICNHNHNCTIEHNYLFQSTSLCLRGQKIVTKYQSWIKSNFNGPKFDILMEYQEVEFGQTLGMVLKKTEEINKTNSMNIHYAVKCGCISSCIIYLVFHGSQVTRSHKIFNSG